MKNTLHLYLKRLGLFVPLLLVLTLCACDKFHIDETYKTKVPIYLTLGDIRSSSFTIVEPTPFESTGKIYLYKDYLFVNEPNKGIHIYNNTNPADPKAIGFLPILGNFDLGIQNDHLYADNIVDLLTFDISDIHKPVLIDRQKDVFSVTYKSQTGNRDVITDNDPVSIIGYKDTIVNSTYEETYYPDQEDLIYYDSGTGSYNNSGSGSNNSGSGNQIGIAGSLARFAISSNYLYSIFQDRVKNFTLQNPKSPKYVNEVKLGFGIETLFPYKNSLFVGANNGMHILDISAPTKPVEIATYTHVFACDPVVVNDNYAFVTLRTGTVCGGSQNVLEVVDIKDLKKPKQVKVYDMTHPHGLALSGDYLYLSEGDFGLKSFNVKDVLNIKDNQIQYLDALKSRDIIAGPKSLIVLGPQSICQFDYSNKANLKQLSCISINNKK